jgi:hypothetical protein
VAVNAYKQIWTFTSTNGGTWSEIFYVQSATIDQAANITPGFINKRLAMLHPLNFLEKIRVSENNNLRNSKVIKIALNGLWQGSTQPYPVSSAAVITLRSTVIPSSRQWWLRGIARDFCFREATTGRDELAAAALTALNTFLQELQDKQYIVLPKVNQTAIGVPPNPIVGVDGNTVKGQSLLLLQNQQVFAPGSFINLTKFSKKDLPGMNGRYKVIAQNANQISVKYTTPNFQIYLGLQGFVQPYVPNVGAIISKPASYFNFFGEHQSKNAYTGSRGAKSAARVRSLA